MKNDAEKEALRRGKGSCCAYHPSRAIGKKMERPESTPCHGEEKNGKECTSRCVFRRMEQTAIRGSVFDGRTYAGHACLNSPPEDNLVGTQFCGTRPLARGHLTAPAYRAVQNATDV